MGPAREQPPDAPNWLPQFCSGPTLFAVMIVAELVAVIVTLVGDVGVRAWLPRIGIVSLYVQWIALLNSVVLCSMRGALGRVPDRAGFVIAWTTTLAVTALGSAVIARLDQARGVRLAAPPDANLRFVFVNAVICALIAAALLRYLFVHERWRERVRAAAKAQVDALQARIRPHFLFNSMNTIASLVRTRPADAERTVEDLSELFRAALGADSTPGTLGEELDLVGRYLDIERLRLGDRLRASMDVDALPRDFPMPRLLLQPLIENAIYHGIQPREDGGELVVRGRRLADGIEIEIANPLPPTQPVRGNGVALANVRARIEYHFGARAQLRVDPGGADYVVTVKLPLGATR